METFWKFSIKIPKYLIKKSNIAYDIETKSFSSYRIILFICFIIGQCCYLTGYVILIKRTIKIVSYEINVGLDNRDYVVDCLW